MNYEGQEKGEPRSFEPKQCDDVPSFGHCNFLHYSSKNAQWGKPQVSWKS